MNRIINWLEYKCRKRQRETWGSLFSLGHGDTDRQQDGVAGRKEEE